MKIARVTALLLLMLTLTPAAARAEPDAKAVAVGKAMWEALGGDAGWQKARYFRFDFVVEKGGKRVAVRSHYWDRFSGAIASRARSRASRGACT
jgi:hypothetical protein